MMFRRIFAGWIVALLLPASGLAAACDVSCAFAVLNSDCNSKPAVAKAAMPGGMKMDGMAMAGMNMPDSAGGEDQQSTSELVESKASHPQIGEMGPCERKSCWSDSAISAGPACSNNWQLLRVFASAGTSPTDIFLSPFHDARDALLTPPAFAATHLRSTLRI